MEDGIVLKLLKAARDGTVKEFWNEVKPGTNIDEAMSPEGNTVLHIAARFGRNDLVGKIVERYPSLVLKSNLKGETPIHLAAKAGNLNIVQKFIKRVEGLVNKGEPTIIDQQGISIASIRDKYGNTPLHGAVRNNYDKVVKALADADKESLVLINDAGESPLSIAIDMRFKQIAGWIINFNASTLEFIGHNGQTALHHAVLRDDSETMDKILARMASVKVLDKETKLVRVADEKKRTPLHYAAAFCNQTMVEKLLDKDPSVAYMKDSNHQSPVHLAAKYGHIILIKTLLDRCPDTIEIVDNMQRNILHVAAESGNLDVVSHILSLKEMEDLVNSPDADGNTPLHLAAKNCYSDVVAALSKNSKVEIRAINNDNMTALAISKSPDVRGMELQKHLTLKALKVTYKRRGLDPDHDILENTHLNDEDLEKARKIGEKGKDMAKRISFMSPLIATFTFTGAFTIPGGFKNNGPDEGMATLITRAAFWAFVISDTIAMTSSIASAVITFWSISRADRESFMDTLPLAIFLTWISLLAMTVAFVTGLFVVLRKTLWLAILICLIGCVASFLLYVVAPVCLLREPRLNQRNLVEENPLLFVIQSIELRTGIPIRRILSILIPIKYLSFICKWSCCSNRSCCCCCCCCCLC